MKKSFSYLSALISVLFIFSTAQAKDDAARVINPVKHTSENKAVTQRTQAPGDALTTETHCKSYICSGANCTTIRLPNNHPACRGK